MATLQTWMKISGYLRHPLLNILSSLHAIQVVSQNKQNKTLKKKKGDNMLQIQSTFHLLLWPSTVIWANVQWLNR